jgi:hypothetical protein
MKFIDENIGTVVVEVNVPLYIDEVLGKKPNEITKEDVKLWRSIIEDDFILHDYEHDVLFEHGSWNYKSIINHMKSELGYSEEVQ